MADQVAAPSTEDSQRIMLPVYPVKVSVPELDPAQTVAGEASVPAIVGVLFTIVTVSVDVAQDPLVMAQTNL